MNDGISTATPGYLLTNQVPPTDGCLSTMTKSSIPARRSLTPAAMPPNPAPTTRTSCCGRVCVLTVYLP
ncbi:Uncharacterised protein [Mycobacteroides abscessus subsp. abscessus]|nr:Uncharacterised protein [Mycobacteroides abscessus subsp. abscessus]